MQYVSELIGASVRDPDGHIVAKISDLLVPADADYPALEALALKPPKGETRTVPWSAIRVLDDGAVVLWHSIGGKVLKRLSTSPAMPDVLAFSGEEAEKRATDAMSLISGQNRKLIAMEYLVDRTVNWIAISSHDGVIAEG